MSELGKQLREARLARGYSLDDVQEMTKIRKRYLEAIEAGDYKVLPGSFYVRAFIKTYAEAVGVNHDELMNEHNDAVPGVSSEPTMEPVLQKRRSTRVAERNSKWLSTTLMWSFFVVILVVVYMYFTVWGVSKEAKDNEPDQTPITNESREGTGNSSGKDKQNGAGTGAGNDLAGGNDATGNNGANSGNNGTNTDSGNTGTTPDAGQQTVIVTPDGTEGSITKFLVQPAGDEPVQVVITSTGRSWVEVRKGNKDGEKLYYANTSDTGGDVLTYELGAEGLFIKSGASSKTEITVGGQVVEDGKNTSKIQLNIGSAVGGSTGEDQQNSNDTVSD